MPDPDDPDDLDACVHAGVDPELVTADGDIDAVVMFADIDPADQAAVDARRSEWAELLA